MNRNKSLLIIGIFCLIGIMSSCSDDDPLYWPGELNQDFGGLLFTDAGLSLSYGGQPLWGKKVEFHTDNSKTATLTLKDIVPGETETIIENVSLTAEEGVYHLKGETTTSQGAKVRCEGTVCPETLVVNFDVTIPDPNHWGKDYLFSEVTKEMSESLGTEIPVTSAGYSDTQMLPEYGSNYNVLLRSALGYFLPQFIGSIQLEADGNIRATYSAGAVMINGKIPDMTAENAMMDIIEFIVMKLMSGGLTAADVAAVTDGRNYRLSPANLAYWTEKDNRLYVKLNLPAILPLLLKIESNEQNDKLIATLTNIVLKGDPLKMKELLTTLNQKLNNEILNLLLHMDDNNFTQIFSWLTDGIPFHADQANGHTHIYLDVKTLRPVLELIPELSPLIINMLPEDTPEYAQTMIQGLLEQFGTQWSTAVKFNLGVDLIAR